jgi:NAD-dependent deacetylase
MLDILIDAARAKLEKCEKLVAFTGAGISVASGIPPFRGPDGLWSKYDPSAFDIDFFLNNTKESWRLIKEIFYSFLLKDVKPNPAHISLAKLGCPVITQNIDNLHQAAGSKDVVEFHGTAETLVCMSCGRKFKRDEVDFESEIPTCKACGGILKPDFVFFKEPIPKDAFDKSIELAKTCDCMLVIGTTGEIMPASQIPYIAKRNGAFIIEINPNPSNYSYDIADIFLQGKAEEILPKLID